MTLTLKSPAFREEEKIPDRYARGHGNVSPPLEWSGAPEGTRSTTGELGKFKRGGFNLAIDARLRILPVIVDGSLRIHRAGDRQVHKHQTVGVKIRPPIDAAAYGRARAVELVEAVRATILDALPPARAIGTT